MRRTVVSTSSAGFVVSECSECGYIVEDRWVYCPCCGAAL
jgi:rubrerythrin